MLLSYVCVCIYICIYIYWPFGPQLKFEWINNITFNGVILLPSCTNPGMRMLWVDKNAGRSGLQQAPCTHSNNPHQEKRGFGDLLRPEFCLLHRLQTALSLFILLEGVCSLRGSSAACRQCSGQKNKLFSHIHFFEHL